MMADCADDFVVYCCDTPTIWPLSALTVKYQPLDAFCCSVYAVASEPIFWRRPRMW